MPNHKLSQEVRDIITRRTRQDLRRRLDYAQADFPLTTATIQAALLPAKTLTAIRKLNATGWKQTPSTRTVWVNVSRGDYPGLHRAVPLRLSLPENIYEPADIHHYGVGTVFDPKDGGRLHALTLDPADRALVAAWTNRVVRELRLGELTSYAVQTVMKACTSTAEVLAAWPLLATLVEDDTWRSRFRNPPRNVHRWAQGVAAKNTLPDIGKLLAAAEVVLLGAELLEVYNKPPGVVYGVVEAWERLPNDRRYN